MNWIAFNGILLNLDHTLSIEYAGSKSLDVYIARSPKIVSKHLTFNTEQDRNAAFDKISAFVTGESKR